MWGRVGRADSGKQRQEAGWDGAGEGHPEDRAGGRAGKWAMRAGRLAESLQDSLVCTLF